MPVNKLYGNDISHNKKKKKIVPNITTAEQLQLS